MIEGMPAPEGLADTEAPVRYAEDAVGLTWPVKLLWLPPVVIAVVTVLFTPSPVWSGVVGGAAALVIFALTYLHQCWLDGIRVTATEIRIGGCRKTDARRRKGRGEPQRIDPRMRHRIEFVAPLDAVRAVSIVGPAEFAGTPKRLDPLPGSRRTRPASLGNLRSRWAAAALVLDVDLARAQVPALRMYYEQLGPHRSTSSFVLTDRWSIATRQPDRLRQALADVGLTVLDRTP